MARMDEKVYRPSMTARWTSHAVEQEDYGIVSRYQARHNPGNGQDDSKAAPRTSHDATLVHAKFHRYSPLSASNRPAMEFYSSLGSFDASSRALRRPPIMRST